MTKKRIVSRRTFVDPKKVGKTKPSGSTRSVVVKTQESLWDCTSCGTTGIKGRNKICPNCGHTKDAGEQYREPGSDAPALTKHELDKMGVDAQHHSDETCSFCGSKNKPGTQTCNQCGASLADVARTNRICDNCGRETSEGTCPNCGAVTRLKSEPLHQQTVQAYRPTTSYPTTHRRETSTGFDLTDPRVWVPALGLLFIALMALIFWPRQAEVQVKSVGWKAEVFLQEYQYNQHEGWSLPAGADLVSTRQKEHHTI
ncbi:MAG: zinc ribbon domain-containing protein [Pseudomonadales bacterium]|nr:zinc ribbon domain-containing protein [Pseudomonadales bacterium]